MNRDQARRLLRQALTPYREKTYNDLRGLIGEIDAHEVLDTDGAEFQVEIEAMWDGRPGGDIRVLGSIDDGGWSTLAPVNDSFVISSKGTLHEA